MLYCPVFQMMKQRLGGGHLPEGTRLLNAWIYTMEVAQGLVSDHESACTKN